MDITDELLCIFSADIDKQDGSYTVTIPEREITREDVNEEGTYRVVLIDTDTKPTEIGKSNAADSQTNANADENPEPPVNVGDHRTVEIEDIGSQGDGIARVERSYVIIVPETEEGNHVTIKITEVKQTVAFGEVIEQDIATETSNS